MHFVTDIVLMIYRLWTSCVAHWKTAMTMAELTKVAKFNEADISLDAVWHERNNWVKRCSLLGDVPSIKALWEKLAEEEALKFMMPNLHMLCVYTVPYQKYSYPTKYPCSDCAIYRLNIQVKTKMVIEIYR